MLKLTLALNPMGGEGTEIHKAGCKDATKVRRTFGVSAAWETEDVEVENAEAFFRAEYLATKDCYGYSNEAGEWVFTPFEESGVEDYYVVKPCAKEAGF